MEIKVTCWSVIFCSLFAVMAGTVSAETLSFTDAARLQSLTGWQDGAESIALKDATETGTGLRHGLLRLDLSSINGTVTNASITINPKKLVSYTLYLWGVVDSAPGQTWNGTTTTMADVAASGMFAPVENLESANDPNLVLLGSQSVVGAGLNQYDNYTFSSPALIDWVNSDTDNDATVLVSIGENINTAMRSISAGSNAPVLEYVVLAAPPPPSGFRYPLYAEADQLYSNTVPYDLTQETYTFSEVFRIPGTNLHKPLNSSTTPNKSPLATRGDSTFMLVVDEGRRGKVVKITDGVVEEGYLDNTLYQPDEFYSNNDSDPDNDRTVADFHRWLDDGHHSGALGVDEQGYIHVVGDMHNYPRYANPMAHLPLRFHDKHIMYWRSDNPYDVSSFSFVGDQAANCPQGIGFTYPYFFNDMHGKLHFTSRVHQADTTRCAGYSRFNAVSGTWSVVGGTVSGEPDHPRLFWEDNGEGGSHYNKTHPFGVFDRDNNMHVSAPLLNTDKPPEGSVLHFATDILYLKSTDGGQSFTKADGSPVALPARAEAGANQADVVYTNEYLSVLGNVACDYENNPYTVASVKYADGSDKDSYVIGWNGTSWENYGDIGNRGAADYRLVHDPAGVMTLIPDSYYKIWRFWKPDGVIREVTLPWSLKNIDYEYLKKTGDFIGLRWDGDDLVVVKVEINNRPGRELIDPDTNTPPVFSTDPIIGNVAMQGITYAGNVALATDADGDSLEYAMTGGSGWLAVSTNGILSGIPVRADAGRTNHFTVQVVDGKGGVTNAALEIYVISTDTDGDGLTDAQELSLGSNPDDPNSGFGIDGTPLPMSGKIQITWPSATGVLYRIWQSPDLVDWSISRNWTNALTPPQDVIEQDLTPSNGFFRVEAEIQ